MKNNLKDDMEKIKMSDKTKERIIAACEEAARNKAINRNDNEYIDRVYGVEKVKPRNRIMRSISAIAACAVLVGGIGTTGFLLHRQNSTQMSGSEVSGTECRSCPFGDFSEFDYRFDAGDGKR